MYLSSRFQLLPIAIALLLCGFSFLTPSPEYPLPPLIKLPTLVAQKPAPAMTTLENYTRRVARSLGVDEALVLAVLIQESDPVNPLKTGKGDSRGPLQIKPIALEDIGISRDERSLPVLVYGGVLYLKKMLARFHSLPMALAAYNMGPERLIERDYRPYIDTQRYIRQVLARAEAIRSGTFPPHPILQYRFPIGESRPF